jgi:hypothetical protein
MNFKYRFVKCLLKYIFTVSFANCVFAYNTLYQCLSKTTKMSLWHSTGKRKNVALVLKGLNFIFDRPVVK